ncbi:bacillithiol biosynthesis deacetylase BshB1 [Balneolales bacterium ANBcel1]|nr:bacillithiol biosynthesis deacetylase BshB1 [Balneolales bacterium ANBcel1]
MKLDLLAIAAHPDDVELCCAGTLAALARSGKKCGILDLTRGEMGTRGTPEVRLEEARKAAEVMGLAMRDNAGLPDCGLDNTPEYREAIIRRVRAFRPEVCLINAREDRHPDHRNAAALSLDALFYSGLAKLPTFSDDGTPQKPWRPKHIMHFMQHWPFKPTFVFDITDTIDIKERAIRAFASQFNVGDGDNGPKTYVSSPRFFEALRGRAQEYGQHIGVEFGEPYLYYGGPVPLTTFDVLFSARPER